MYSHGIQQISDLQHLQPFSPRHFFLEHSHQMVVDFYCFLWPRNVTYIHLLEMLGLSTVLASDDKSVLKESFSTILDDLTFPIAVHPQNGSRERWRWWSFLFGRVNKKRPHLWLNDMTGYVESKLRRSFYIYIVDKILVKTVAMVLKELQTA